MLSVNDIRQLLAQGVGAAVNLDNIIRARNGRYVLAYHRIIPKEQAESEGVHHAMWVTPQSLSSQISWMQSVGEIVDHSRILNTSIDNDKPLFALTFDDGWKDNYEHAFPILKNNKVKATIFLATNAVDTGKIFWPDDISIKSKRRLIDGSTNKVRGALLKYWPCNSLIKANMNSSTMEIVECWIEALKLIDTNRRIDCISGFYISLGICHDPLSGYLMNWDDVMEMSSHGIAFGSHTHNHTIIKGLPSEEIYNELNYSKALISEKIQLDIDSFCYPNARYNGKEAEILSRCGYRYAFCLNNRSLNHCSSNFYIPRFLMSERFWKIPAYFKLRLLEAPLYQSKIHNPDSKQP